MSILEAKFSLLMTDDDPSVLSLLQNVFSQEDYHLHTALNGRDALDLLREIKIDAAMKWASSLRVFRQNC